MTKYHLTVFRSVDIYLNYTYISLSLTLRQVIGPFPRKFQERPRYFPYISISAFSYLQRRVFNVSLRIYPDNNEHVSFRIFRRYRIFRIFSIIFNYVSQRF